MLRIRPLPAIYPTRTCRNACLPLLAATLLYPHALAGSSGCDVVALATVVSSIIAQIKAHARDCAALRCRWRGVRRSLIWFRGCRAYLSRLSAASPVRGLSSRFHLRPSLDPADARFALVPGCRHPRRRISRLSPSWFDRVTDITQYFAARLFNNLRVTHKHHLRGNRLDAVSDIAFCCAPGQPVVNRRLRLLLAYDVAYDIYARPRITRDDHEQHTQQHVIP